MTQDVPEKSHRVHCNACGQTTSHNVLFKDRRVLADEHIPAGAFFECYLVHRLIICAGCQLISLERATSDSESELPNGTQLWVTEYFPPRLYRPIPLWLENGAIPEHVQRLLRLA